MKFKKIKKIIVNLEIHLINGIMIVLELSAFGLVGLRWRFGTFPPIYIKISLTS